MWREIKGKWPLASMSAKVAITSALITVTSSLANVLPPLSACDTTHIFLQGDCE